MDVLFCHLQVTLHMPSSIGHLSQVATSRWH